MDWNALIERGETSAIEFKSPCGWQGEARARLSKAIASMANSQDGGRLIIGVEELRESGGVRLAGVSAEQLATFDPTRVLQYVNERFEPAVRLNIEKPVVGGVQLVVIVVREFEEQPHVCVREIECEGRKLARPGDLLVRTAAAQSKVVGPQELRELLSRAITKRSDQLLEQVRRIVKGETSSPPAFDWRGAYAVELSEWSDAVAAARELSPAGGWNFQIVPVGVIEDPLPHREIRDILERSAVHLRGWTFPRIEGSDPKNMSDRVAGSVESKNLVESWAVFRNLIFSYYRSFVEDLGFIATAERPAGSSLDFVGVIYTVAEFLMFAKRFSQEAGYQGELVLRVELSGCKDRKLISTSPERYLRGNYACAERQFQVQTQIHTAQLAAGLREEVVALCVEVFSYFHWMNPSQDMILEDVKRLQELRI